MKLVLKGQVTMVKACRQFGIRRKTGYKILARHAERGMSGLADASRAPRSHPNQTSSEIEAAVLRVRKAHPTWGSKKILWTLLRERPSESWPARSTVDAILSRAGVVVPRGRRRRRQPTAPPVVEAAAPNDVWSMDYKGWFRVGDGTRCDPLTGNDVCTRASLVCQAMVAPKSPDVKRRLEQAFVVFGLPRFMLSDCGPPFGSTGLGRLSRLGVWLLRIGVVPILIEPGRPDSEWSPRAVPRDPEGRDRHAAMWLDPGATEGLQPLPEHLQRRASSRGARDEDPGRGLRAVASPAAVRTGRSLLPRGIRGP
ncbi:MAG: transposase [Planctomycetes bacterium]|nr:transposase [Planctomycetota bacterium]